MISAQSCKLLQWRKNLSIKGVLLFFQNTDAVFGIVMTLFWALYSWWKTVRSHNSIKSIQAALIPFHWLSGTEINMILRHLNICVYCADGVLQTPWRARAKKKQHVYAKRQENGSRAAEKQRLWVRIQNHNRQLKTRVCKACHLMLSAGKWSEGEEARTRCLCVINKLIIPRVCFTCI